MPSYSINYDLRQPGRNYQPLYDMLNNGGAVRALQSLWLIDDPNNSATVRDTLRSVLDENDGLLVTEITNNNWAGSWLLPGAAEWLLARFP